MNAEPADDDLALLLADLTARLGARAGAVLLDPGDGCSRIVQAHDPEAVIDWSSRAPTCAIDRPHWMAGEHDGSGDLLLAPAHETNDGGRCAIATIFARLGPDGRRAAELAYARAAPLAHAGLRLWLRARAAAVAVRSLRAALDWSGLGVVLLDHGGGIVFANQAARALLDAGDGLRRSGNRVVTRDLGDTVRLQLAVEHVVTARATHRLDAPLLAIGRAGGPALMLSVLPPATDDIAVAAILYVMDPARDVGELLRPVCRAYRLSPAETLLARHLVAGDTVVAAAAQMGVKAMTARGYLKQIFLKTDTHRQPELVQLMLSSIIHTHPTASEP